MYTLSVHMARYDKSGPTRVMNVRMPVALLDELERMVKNGETPYSNVSELVKQAIRAELDRIKKERAGLIMTAEG